MHSIVHMVFFNGKTFMSKYLFILLVKTSIMMCSILSNKILSCQALKWRLKRMKKVITYGTFDLLHTGHINILKRAKEYGDYLIVAISTDEFNDIKNKKAYYSFEQRKAILEAIRYVDEVIPEETWEQKVEDVQKYDIDVFVMGDDWKGKFDFLKEYCEVIYLPRTVGISTTQIKKDLNKAHNG